MTLILMLISNLKEKIISQTLIIDSISVLTSTPTIFQESQELESLPVLTLKNKYQKNKKFNRILNNTLNFMEKISYQSMKFYQFINQISLKTIKLMPRLELECLIGWYKSQNLTNLSINHTLPVYNFQTDILLQFQKVSLSPNFIFQVLFLCTLLQKCKKSTH